MAFRNILVNALNPRYLPGMLRKLVTRPRFGFNEREEAEKWARQRALPLSVWAESINRELWTETVSFADDFRLRGEQLLAPLTAQGIDMGGGGSIELLYFLTRLRKPQIVLETGVAAGWSSCAILSAMEHNLFGELRSSDFPYFRMDRPEQHIGILVAQNLRSRWWLELDGDRRNVPKLLSDGAVVDVAHYDSDKSRPGREWFADRVLPHLSETGIIVWDDIVDNLVFRERAERVHEALVLDTPNGLVGLELRPDSLVML